MIVDVDVFALQNAYEVNYGPSSGIVVLLNAGASAININILSGAQSVFTRDVSMGGNAFTEAVQKELNLAFDGAEQLKKGQPQDGATYDAARPVLQAMTDNVLLEVEKTFDFFKGTASNDHIDRIVLSGGASRVEGFADALHDRFRRAGRALRSVPAGQLRREAGWACRPTRWRRSRPSRSASRSGGWVTDDSRQPHCRRTPRGQGRRPFDRTSRQKVTIGGRRSCSCGRARRAAIVYWSMCRRERDVAASIDAAKREEARLTEVLEASRGVRSAARAPAAARRAHRRAAARAERARAHRRSDQPRAARDDVADAA